MRVFTLTLNHPFARLPPLERVTAASAEPKDGSFAMRSTMFSALVLAVALTTGCGQSETPNAGKASATPMTITADQVATSADVPTDPVARVVYDFLDAVRQGNTAVASQLLTPLALQKTSEMDFVFAPPGSPTARFEIGASELIEKDKAVVDSVWTDLDADGKPHSEPTLWALRLTNGQWRISGMAAEIGAAQPMVIDFENPETMAPPKPVDPATIAGPAANQPAPQPASEVARNPFDQPAQR
jgi:hypothetical protein